MEKTIKNTNITEEAINNATWEYHDNWTDNNVPSDGLDDGQDFYKSAQTTIDGHVVEISYDINGLWLNIDGHEVSERNGWVDEDGDECVGISLEDLAHVAGESLGENLQDLDDLYDRWKDETDPERIAERLADEFNEIEDRDEKYELLDEWDNGEESDLDQCNESIYRRKSDGTLFKYCFGGPRTQYGKTLEDGWLSSCHYLYEIDADEYETWKAEHKED